MRAKLWRLKKAWGYPRYKWKIIYLQCVKLWTENWNSKQTTINLERLNI